MKPTTSRPSSRDSAGLRSHLDMLIVCGHAVAAGLFVVVFNVASDKALGVFRELHRWNPWAMLLWTPAVSSAGVWLMRRWASGAAGSGIPQVMIATTLEQDPVGARRFVSLRLSVVKIALGVAAAGGGLSVGREGPAVQIAAGVMAHAKRWLSPSSGPGARALLIGGGAAGVAAAFNAPLAGAVFAAEQLGQTVQHQSYRWVISSVALASIAAALAIGNCRYFDGVQVSPLTVGLLVPALMVAIVCGMAGGLFARLVIRSLTGAPVGMNRWRARWPVAFAAICGLAVALIGLASNGATFGSGSDTVEQLLKGRAPLPPIDTAFKFIATWLTSWCGTSGGLLSPSLSIGAGIGDGIAQLADPAMRSALISIGMAAFLAAVTQTPLTAAVIVTEMLGEVGLALALLPAAAIASALSRSIGPPLYATLAAHLVRPAPSSDLTP